MRTESTQASPLVAPSAATAAFQVAVVQQKQFEETLDRVSEKQSQAAEEERRKAERSDDVVDIKDADSKTLASNETDASSGGAENASAPDVEAIGAKVNVSV